MPGELERILSECMREARSIEELAEKLSARGVVPIVRCEECRWWDGLSCLNVNGCARYAELNEEERSDVPKIPNVCLDCIHVPICRYCASCLKNFKLPAERSSCDLFESVNGYGEERTCCEKGGVPPCEEACEDGCDEILSFADTLKALECCAAQGEKGESACVGCPNGARYSRGECGGLRVLARSALAYLK